MLSKFILVSSVILILMFIFFRSIKTENIVNDAHPIVFFGNSITAGQGAAPGEDFPNIIAKKLNVPIINAGVSGNTSSDALLRINNDVIKKHPSIVVIELGGNDLIDHVNSEVTTRNLNLILSNVKSTKAKIIILGVKIFLFNVKYETNLQSLAKKYNAIYIPNILEGIITDQSLKYDDIHPNAKGYQKIAENLIPILAPLIQKTKLK